MLDVTSGGGRSLHACIAESLTVADSSCEKGERTGNSGCVDIICRALTVKVAKSGQGALRDVEQRCVNPWELVGGKRRNPCHASRPARIMKGTEKRIAV